MTDQIRVGLVRVEDILFHAHNTRIDLGDLRSLAHSIDTYGVMQPVVVEQHGDTLRLRAGHRRVAAARIVHLPRIPAIIHSESLPEKEWLEHAIQENFHRRDLDEGERRRAIVALRRLGCTRRGIADTFDVTEATVRGWAVKEPAAEAPWQPATAPVASAPAAARPVGHRGPSARVRATQRLIHNHQAEFDAILAAEHASDRPAA